MQMSGANLHERQRAKLSGLVGADPFAQFLLLEEGGGDTQLKRMPMTALHTPDKLQWFMEGQGCDCPSNPVLLLWLLVVSHGTRQETRQETHLKTPFHTVYCK